MKKQNNKTLTVHVPGCFLLQAGEAGRGGRGEVGAACRGDTPEREETEEELEESRAPSVPSPPPSAAPVPAPAGSEPSCDFPAVCVWSPAGLCCLARSPLKPCSRSRTGGDLQEKCLNFKIPLWRCNSITIIQQHLNIMRTTYELLTSDFVEIEMSFRECV